MNKFYNIPGMADCKNLHQTLAAVQPSKKESLPPMVLLRIPTAIQLMTGIEGFKFQISSQ